MMSALPHMIDRLRRPFHVLGNQGFNSLVNFAYTVFLVRALGVEEFGVYSVYYLVALNGGALAHAIVSQPAISIAANVTGGDRAGLLSTAAALLAAVTLGLATIAGLIPLVGNAVGLANPLSGWTMLLLLVSLIVPEFVRRLLLFANWVRRAWLLDITRLALTGGLFGVLVLNGAHTSDPYVACFALGQFSALTIVAVLELRVGRVRLVRPTMIWLRRLLNSGRWLGLTSLLQFFNEHFHLLVASALLGSYALGVVRAIQSLVGLANPLLFSLEHLLPRRLGADAMRIGEEAALQRYRTAAGFAVLGFGGLMLALAAFAEPVLYFVLSPALSAHAWELRAFCAIYVLLLLRSLVSFVFRYGENTVPVLVGIAIGSATSVVTAFPLIVHFGISGVLIGIALAQVVATVSMAVLLSRWLRRRPHAVSA
jgi:O-antigen/teichoic acid export membrane protein